ncbi:putative proton-dependent oligopeptide transporter family, MFS transporter superfamily [Helianthus anomalus]
MIRFSGSGKIFGFGSGLTRQPANTTRLAPLIVSLSFGAVNEAFEKVASGGLMSNMMFYLMEVYHMEAVTGTSVIYMWAALSTGLSIFGAFVSDSYLGRFRVIAFGSLSSLLLRFFNNNFLHLNATYLTCSCSDRIRTHAIFFGSFTAYLSLFLQGVSLLWLTSIFPQLTPSCSSCPPTPAQLGVLFVSLGLISIGSGCIKPCSIAFGADQLKHHNNQRLIDSYFNWYYASATISTVIASTIVVYIQDQFGWRVGFAVPVLVMLCSTLMFLLGSPLYVKVKVNKSPFTGFGQVLIAAFRNRKISLVSDDCYNHNNDMDRVELTDNLRFVSYYFKWASIKK